MPMNPKLLRPKASGFNPRRISGLAVWLDASDGATLFQNSDGTVPATATSDPIGAWMDKSGNQRTLTQPIANNRPSHTTQALNGRSAVSFDGVNDFVSAQFSLTQPVTIFCVGNYRAPLTHAGQLFDASPAGNRMRFYLPTSTTVGLFAGTALTSGTISPSGWSVWGTVFNVGNSAIRRDGLAIINGLAGSLAPNGITLGAFGDGLLTPTNCQIAEFVLYNRVLTNAERGTVERYLGLKWGITVV